MRLQGAWTAANLTQKPVWDALAAQLKALRAQAASPAALRWSLAPLEKLDYLGAQVLWNAWKHHWPAELADRARAARHARNG